MENFENVSYDQACRLLERHGDNDVTVITAPFPGMSLQVTGTLFVQSSDPFAFAVVSSERLSMSMMPFPDCIFQISKNDAGAVEALVCAMPGPEAGAEIMMWMVRF